MAAQPTTGPPRRPTIRPNADRRNFYQVEKWSRDGQRVELLLCAGNNLDKARRIFERAIKRRRRSRPTILKLGLLRENDLAVALADCRKHLAKSETAFTLYSVAQVWARKRKTRSDERH